MKKPLMLATIALLLTGCGGDGFSPNSICLERDVGSSICIKQRFFCIEPMELKAGIGGTPRCFMPTEKQP